MIWNDAEFYTSFFMIELEEGVSFLDSPIALYGAFTSLDSPALRDPAVKEFLQGFTHVQNQMAIEIDKVEGMVKELPGIFILPARGISHVDALRLVNEHLDSPYTPVHSDFRAIGFFPSRDECPVREVSKEGIAYNNGVEMGKEVIASPPGWAMKLVEGASKYCDARYSHYKISENGTRNKAYTHATKLY